jgi:hypothetical protein
MMTFVDVKFLSVFDGQHQKEALRLARKKKFPIKFRFPPADEEMLAINDVFQQKKYKDYSMEELLSKLTDDNNLDYGIEVAKWLNKVQVDYDLYPKATMVELGKLKSDQDINRELNVSHATKIYGDYDPHLYQPIYCIKTPKKDKWTIVNGQHTATSTAGIVSDGWMKDWGKDSGKDWRNFKVLVIYVETNSRAKARKAFALLNGKMSLKIAKYDEWKQAYLSVKLDKEKDGEYVHLYNIILRMRDKGIIPLPEDHDDIGLPGACVHLSGIEAMCKFDYKLPPKDQDFTKLDFWLNFHERYLSDVAVDAAEYGIATRLLHHAEQSGVDVKSESFVQFVDDLMATWQRCFNGDFDFTKTVCVDAYVRYRGAAYNSPDKAGMGYDGSLYPIYKAYRHIGGTFELSSLENLFVKEDKDVIHYLSETVIKKINSFSPKNKQIVRKTYSLPKELLRKARTSQ